MSETVSAPCRLATRFIPAPAPTLLELFLAFALISLCGFGGVLAWSRRMLVEERKWMTPEEFNDAYALCQFLPGPNVVNLSVVFGRRIRGPVGRGGRAGRLDRAAVRDRYVDRHALCALRRDCRAAEAC